jgi:hypothetical protein
METNKKGSILNLDEIDVDSNDFDLNEIDLPQSSSLNTEQNVDYTPTLESILNEKDDDQDEFLDLDQINNFESSDKLSLKSRTSSIASNQTSTSTAKLLNQSKNLNSNVCKEIFLKFISSQLNDAIERENSNTGMATSLCTSQDYIAIGTSRGKILIFDLNQILKFSLKTSDTMDSISALSFNNTSTRLLVGNIRGFIYMFDLSQPNNGGKLLRLITDAHQIDSPILHIKFTDDYKLAVFSDSGGSVFTLEFTRTMGIRSYNSTCLFSGSKGN